MAAPTPVEIQKLKAQLLILDLSHPHARTIIDELATAMGKTLISATYDPAAKNFKIEIDDFPANKTYPNFAAFIASIPATGLPEVNFNAMKGVIAEHVAQFTAKSTSKSDAELLTEEITKLFGAGPNPTVEAFLKKLTKGAGYTLSQDPLTHKLSIEVGGTTEDLATYIATNGKSGAIAKALGELSKPAPKKEAPKKEDFVLGGVLDNDELRKIQSGMVNACNQANSEKEAEVHDRGKRRGWILGGVAFLATLPIFPANILIGAAAGKLIYEGSVRMDHYMDPASVGPKEAAVTGLRDYLIKGLERGDFNNPAKIIGDIEAAMAANKDVGEYKDIVRKKNSIRTPEDLAIAVMEARCSGLGRHDRQEIAGIIREEIRQRKTLSAAHFGGKPELLDAANELTRAFKLEAVSQEKEESKSRYAVIGSVVGGAFGFGTGLLTGGFFSGVFGAAGSALGGWIGGYLTGAAVNRANDFSVVKGVIGDYGSSQHAAETLEKIVTRQIQQGKVKAEDVSTYLSGLEKMGIHPEAIKKVEIGKRLMTEVASNLLNRSGATAALEAAITPDQFDELKAAVIKISDAVDSTPSATDLHTIRRHRANIAEKGPRALSDALEAALTVLGKESGMTSLGALAGQVKAAREAAERAGTRATS